MTNLKKFRNSTGLSQEKMAIKIGTSLSMYAKVESGRVPPSRAFMEKIKYHFPDINIDDIFFATNSNIIADTYNDNC